MEGGTERPTRDTARGTTRTEIQGMKRESARLKTLVAEPPLQVYVLEKQHLLIWNNRTSRKLGKVTINAGG